MVNHSKKRETGCPLTYGLDTFGDRWTLLIIRDLMLRGRKTYREFLEAGEGVATNILADRLKHLEVENIIHKKRDPENYRSFIYTLTEKGCDLVPVIIEVARWSGKYDMRTFAQKNVPERIKKDRDAFEAEIRARAEGKRGESNTL